MSTFEKVRDIVVEQLGVEPRSQSILPSSMIWALTPWISLS